MTAAAPGTGEPPRFRDDGARARRRGWRPRASRRSCIIQIVTTHPSRCYTIVTPACGVILSLLVLYLIIAF